MDNEKLVELIMNESKLFGVYIKIIEDPDVWSDYKFSVEIPTYKNLNIEDAESDEQAYENAEETIKDFLINLKLNNEPLPINFCNVIDTSDSNSLITYWFIEFSEFNDLLSSDEKNNIINQYITNAEKAKDKKTTQYNKDMESLTQRINELKEVLGDLNNDR